MARLFSAFVPPGPVVSHLSERLVPVGDLRWIPVASWHVTLGFYGDGDDPVTRAAWLRERASGLTAPRMRLSGAGSFPGGLWVGVAPVHEDSARALGSLAPAAGRDTREFRPPLPVARAGRGGGGQVAGGLVARLSDYVGPVWTASELVLF